MAGRERPRTDIVETTCPECGARMSCVVHPDPDETRRPAPGTFTFCIRCAHLMVFGDSDSAADLHVREPNEAEHVEALTHPELVLARSAIRAFWGTFWERGGNA